MQYSTVLPLNTNYFKRKSKRYINKYVNLFRITMWFAFPHLAPLSGDILLMLNTVSVFPHSERYVKWMYNFENLMKTQKNGKLGNTKYITVQTSCYYEDQNQ